MHEYFLVSKELASVKVLQSAKEKIQKYIPLAVSADLRVVCDLAATRLSTLGDLLQHVDKHSEKEFDKDSCKSVEMIISDLPGYAHDRFNPPLSDLQAVRLEISRLELVSFSRMTFRFSLVLLLVCFIVL